MHYDRAARREHILASARSTAVSAFVGVVITFLTTVGRRWLWTWGLAAYGALAGFTIYVLCYLLDNAVGERLRRRHVMPDNLVGVPIYFVGGCAGLLVSTFVMQRTGWMPFRMDANDLRVSLVISGGAAIIIGLVFYSFEVMRTRLRESVERIKEQEFAEKELVLAREIQNRLLPPSEIVGDGYRISARNLAARFVAGDFYDVFRLSDGALGGVVADVSGKGMGASLIMASVKAVLPLIAEGNGAAETLRLVSRKLHAELGAREFVALAYFRFEPGRRKLELANAGLPDPYRLRPGRSPETLSVPGPRLPLGVWENVHYESLSLNMEVGERLLLLTDGLPEAPTQDGEPLGYDAIASSIPIVPASTSEILDVLFDSVRRMTAPGLTDDWTALVLEAGELNAANPETLLRDEQIAPVVEALEHLNDRG